MEEIVEMYKPISKRLAEYLPEDKKYIMEIVFEFMVELIKPVKHLQSYKGVNLLPGFNVETIKYAYEDVDFKEDSVFVATFPKTGTTWAMQIIRQMLYGHDKKLDEISKLLTPQMNYLETSAAVKHDAMVNFPFPRILYGTHLPEDLVNVARITKRKGKFIVVLRNPKDQAISLYHFMQQVQFNNIRDRIPSDWPSFFDAFIQGKLPLMSRAGEWYPEHILSWYKHKDNKENFLFLCFEDMKQDCSREIKKIAEFLNLNLSDERLQEVVELTSFTAMKKEIENENNKGTGKLLSRLNFLRKGKVGGWKEVFTVAQSELMDRLIQEKLGHTGIQFKYGL